MSDEKVTYCKACYSNRTGESRKFCAECDQQLAFTTNSPYDWYEEASVDTGEEQ